ncbi:hypothetical protein MTO96_012857 [Rhipicephalus appendiculatus]
MIRLSSLETSALPGLVGRRSPAGLQSRRRRRKRSTKRKQQEDMRATPEMSVLQAAVFYLPYYLFYRKPCHFLALESDETKSEIRE